jgi:hypothetical protein
LNNGGLIITVDCLLEKMDVLILSHQDTDNCVTYDGDPGTTPPVVSADDIIPRLESTKLNVVSLL